MKYGQLSGFKNEPFVSEKFGMLVEILGGKWRMNVEDWFGSSKRHE